MPSLEIHPLSELREEAARLLAARYARRRGAEPLLPDVSVPNRASSRFRARRGLRPQYLRLYRAAP
jgi:hypothetical protein